MFQAELKRKTNYDYLNTSNDYQLFHSQNERTINKRKFSPEQSNDKQMFESSHFNNVTHHSPNSRMLHDENDVILENGFNQQRFHQPNTRKITKIISKENHSLSNNRPTQIRSASALTVSSQKREFNDTSLTQNDIQRLKNVRRHEPVKIQSGSNSGLITPESWKTDPNLINRPIKPKATNSNVVKPEKIENVSQPIINERKSVKPKRDTSSSKPLTTENKSSEKRKTENSEKEKPKDKQERSAEEKEQLKKFSEQKRQEEEKKISEEKELKIRQNKERKEKLEKLNEQIKKFAKEPLPSSLIKKTKTLRKLSTPDSDEQKRVKILQLLGPKPINEPPAEQHNNTLFEPELSVVHSRSRSSSSSSSSSVVEIQPPKLNDQPRTYSQSEQFVVEERQHNLLRWAVNLTQTCNDVENKFKYLRPDGTQQFDLIPVSHQELKQDSGNLRIQTPIIIKKNENIEPKQKILRPSGRLSHLNKNQQSEYEDKQLPGVGNLRDPLLEQRVKRDLAAAKIQAVYRGYTVRKSLNWINNKQQPQLRSKHNQRSVPKSKKSFSYSTDLVDAPSIDFADDNFTFGSTLLRQFQRNEPKDVSSSSKTISDRTLKKENKRQLTPENVYSDDYEDSISSRSLTPVQQKQSTPRIIRQPIENRISTTPSTSSSSSTTPTPEPPVVKNIHHRRSISPPLHPPMSPDNGQPIRFQPPPPPPHLIVSSDRITDELRYSPDALERQLNAELHLLDGVEASMKQIENMERLRSVALAQQEVVSLAQILKNKTSADAAREQQLQRSSLQQNSSDQKHRSSPKINLNSRYRSTSSSTSSSSSQSELSEKPTSRRKPDDQIKLQVYEKRLKYVEDKIHSLGERKNQNEKQIKPKLIVSEKRNVSSIVRSQSKTSSESSISEDLPFSQRSSSATSISIPRKQINDTSEIHTETIQNLNDSSSSSSTSVQQQVSDSTTTDASEIKRRIRDYEKQLKTKQNQLDKLKKQEIKDELKRKEDELKAKLETCDNEIKALRNQPKTTKVQQEQKTSAPVRKPPMKSSSSSSSSSSSHPVVMKQQESSIAEELPESTTDSQSKPNLFIKKIEETRPTLKKERDFFDDDEEEEEQKKKKPEVKPLETPRDQRDTQDDAQSLSINTDLATSFENELDSNHQSSTENEKSILNLNKTPVQPTKTEEDSQSSSSVSLSLKQNEKFVKRQVKSPTSSSSSSSSKSNEKSAKQQAKSPSSSTSERKASPIANDYDEDFSEVSYSQHKSSKKSLPEPKIDNIDIESIKEDFEDKSLSHHTGRSLSSKSSDDEQSEILVLVKKSANSTPRKQDDKSLEDDLVFPPPPPPLEIPIDQPKFESNNIYNDDTYHDVSEDEEINPPIVEQKENKVDKMTDTFLRTLIDEAIDQGKQIKHLKREISSTKHVSGNKLNKNENNQQQNKFISNDLSLDLNLLDEPDSNESTTQTARKPIVEEPIKIYVPHTREQVTKLCHRATNILFDQNTDFSNRSTIQCNVPESYFMTDEQDLNDENIRRNHHAYCQMIFDLCAELLHEMYSENIQLPEYPEWQKSRLVHKSFYRGHKPENRHEIEQFIETKILELLTLTTRQRAPSKWRVSNVRRNNTDKFEIVLDEEIRRTEAQWVNYDDDAVQIKFDCADLIFDQLLQETLTECFQVVDKRLFSISNSTRL